MKITTVVDAEFGEQSFFFCNDDHPDVVELLHGNSGLSWFLSKNGVKVASPMDFKAGYNFSTMKVKMVLAATGEDCSPTV